MSVILTATLAAIFAGPFRSKGALDFTSGYGGKLRITTIATTRYDASRPLARWIATSMKAPLGTVGDSQYSRLASSGVEAVPVVNRRDPRAPRSAPTAVAAARAGGPC